MPGIGKRNNSKTRHYLQNGLKKFLLTNVEDIEVLLMNNRTYCAEIATNISSKKRAQIIDRARELNVTLTNGTAKVKSTPSE